MSSLIKIPITHKEVFCYAKKFKNAKLDVFLCDDNEVDLMHDKLGDDVDENRYVALFVAVNTRESYYATEGTIHFYDTKNKCIVPTSSHVVVKRCCDLLELNIPMSEKEYLCQL